MALKTKKDLITFRPGKADEALHLAKYSVAYKYWASIINRLYYSCFYLISALFAKSEIRVYTHNGVKSRFNLFMKENNLDMKQAQLFNDLFDKRLQSDYGDFITFTEDEVLPLIKEVEQFSKEMKKIIREEKN